MRSYLKFNWFLYVLTVAYVIVIVFVETLLLPDKSKWCTEAGQPYPNVSSFPNPLASSDECFRERTFWLLWMNKLETDFARRMLAAAIFGAIIGCVFSREDRVS